MPVSICTTADPFDVQGFVASNAVESLLCWPGCRALCRRIKACIKR